MKTLYKICIAIMLIIPMACKKLDRFPLGAPSSANFLETKDELDLAVNGLYAEGLFSIDSEAWTDNYWMRSTTGNAMIHGSTTSQTSDFSSLWAVTYKSIARANFLITNLPRTQGITDAYRQQALAQARFLRAYNYYMLVTHFGDVPLITATISIEDTKTLKRTAKADIIKYIYSELDFCASVLPATYSGQQFYTKGVALAVKARTALFFADYPTAAAAAQQIMNLKAYALYASYTNLFLKAGEHSSEIIFSIPSSVTYGITSDIHSYLPRNVGGNGDILPTLELMDSYECTDGKTIDKSPLYDYKRPYLNRDPRLQATIVTPGQKFLGFDYEYHPDSVTCMNYTTGKRVANNDCRTVNQFASYDGLLWKKSIDDSELANFNKIDLDQIVIRYAEILLIYAEAKIEMGQIDQSVLDAINMVRARAYGVAYTQTTKYPAITTMDQTQLRTVLRRERRVEFAKEGIRYMDIIRWKIAEKVLNKPVLGLPLAKADFYMPGTPTIDNDGVIDYSSIQSKLSVLDKRSFDPSKGYLWAVPYSQIVLDPSLGQNPGW